MFTRKVVDDLGDWLRDAEVPTREDLELLAEFQAWIGELADVAYSEFAIALDKVPSIEHPVVVLRDKQLFSIVRKLKRQPTTRLSQVQDIVGFRLVVDSVGEQDELVGLLPGPPEWHHLDRRERPSHGYRAYHLVRREGLRRVEVQVRSRYQQAWADPSEMLDRHYGGIKYGVGPATVLDLLNALSTVGADLERAERGWQEGGHLEGDAIVAVRHRALEVIHATMRSLGTTT